MANYVLVHGGYVASWCWDRMMPYLKEDARVSELVAPDLVGHGSRLNEKPEYKITLEDYIQDIVDVIEGQNLHNVVLVGHSMAGIFLPQAVTRVSGRIKRLVLISAMIPSDGKTAIETIEQDFGLSASLSKSKGIKDGKKKSFRDIFCQFMDEDTAQWFMKRVSSTEPPAAMYTPVKQTRIPENVPVTYVKLTRDRWVIKQMQHHFAQSLGNPEIVELESGHNAIMSHPEEMARVLLRYA